MGQGAVLPAMPASLVPEACPQAPSLLCSSGLQQDTDFKHIAYGYLLGSQVLF